MLSQKLLLEAKDSRRILDRVRDDSSSLVCLKDADSCVSLSTQSTGRSSLLSKIFAFDSELIVSNVYQKQTRSLMKKAFRTPERALQLSHTERKKSSQRSAEIERQLRRDKKLQSREVRIGVRGSNRSRLALMVKLTAVCTQATYNEGQRLAHREAFQRRAVNSILDFAQSIPSLLGLPDVLTLCEVSRTDGFPLEPTILHAIETIWTQSEFQRLHREAKCSLWDEADR